MKKASPDAPQPEGQVVQYRKVYAIFCASPIEGSTSRKRAIYISEGWKAIYLMMLIGLPLAPSKPVSFSDSNASTL